MHILDRHLVIIMISHIILIVHLSSWIVTIQERDTEASKSESAAQKWCK